MFKNASKFWCGHWLSQFLEMCKCMGDEYQNILGSNYNFCQSLDRNHAQLRHKLLPAWLPSDLASSAFCDRLTARRFSDHNVHACIKMLYCTGACSLAVLLITVPVGRSCTSKLESFHASHSSVASSMRVLNFCLSLTNLTCATDLCEALKR